MGKKFIGKIPCSRCDCKGYITGKNMEGKEVPGYTIPCPVCNGKGTIEIIIEEDDDSRPTPPPMDEV